MEGRGTRRAFALVFPLLSSLVLLPVAGAAAAQPARGRGTEAARGPQATREEVRPDLGRFFADAGVEGTFVLHDRRRDRIVRYAPERAARRAVPASTFKIFHSLVALETGALPDAETVIPWDGVDRGWSEWNRDHDLRSAFARSAAWFYREVARRIGPEAERAWLEREGYGNARVGSDVERFWLDGPLRISPDEQVAFLRRLQEGDVSFSTATVETVRDVMLVAEGEGWRLRGKTGWTRLEGVHRAWYVGWVERGPDVFTFALHFRGRGEELDVRAHQRRLAGRLLAELGVLEPGALASSTSGGSASPRRHAPPLRG